MWSHDEETGALIENTSSREQLFEVGDQQSSAVLVMQKTAEPDRAAKSPNSELTFALEEEQSRNIRPNFAATLGPTMGTGGRDSLVGEPRGEEVAATANGDLRGLPQQSREVPPAGGVRYGAGVVIQNPAESTRPE